jgi:glucose-6-phosphate 1-dehydrogenase
MKNFVIFGASGDLSRRYIIPALRKLSSKNHKFNYFGFSRSPSPPEFKRGFLKKFQYYTGSYDHDGLSNLAPAITPDTIFYFSLPTSFEIVSSLISGLVRHQLIDSRTRLVIEKPFGSDSRSAKKLMNYLEATVGHENIFLVDHYLTKELVRNLVSLRFANPIISRLWNRHHIQEINIIAIESEGIGGRGQYYDHIGAIRDMIQNHCLQLLSLITMPGPSSFDTIDFSLSKLSILNHLHLASHSLKSVKIGQYHNYLSEPGIDPKSTTETFAEVKFRIDSPQWLDVPITITTGKKLGQKLTEMNIIFRPNPAPHLWSGQKQLLPNALSINLTPDSDIFLSLNSSFQPHSRLPKPKKLHLGHLSVDPSSAYQNIILDVISGVKINTPSFAEIMAQWRLTDEILSLPRLKESLFIY